MTQQAKSSSTISPQGSRIAIIGLGGCFPDADRIALFWDNICRGHVAIREVSPERWDPKLYFSTDHSLPDKTYSRIGGFLNEIRFDAKRFRIPPKTLKSIDDLQKLALTAVADALEDAGLEVFPETGVGRSFNRDRTAVILGNAMGGEFEDLTSMRVWFPEAWRAVEQSPAIQALSEEARAALRADVEARYKERLPVVTEDSMPGELSNCITGRIANCFDLRGANFTTDAACAASMAALKTAVAGLKAGEFDLAIVGGADRSMDPPTYVKFSKIGALSGDMSAPFDARANGFVMGEGVGVMVLKRLEDAVADGDRIYALVAGVGAASDGKGKGMTAPNPRGQKLAVQRAYAEAHVPMSSVGLFEAHGTSTMVGDSTELRVITDLLKEEGAPQTGVPIGSVKSMIGHLKSAAGAASVIKTALAIHHKILPPSANFKSAPSDSPLNEGFLAVNTQTCEWKNAGTTPRRAGVSAFGFGGTNFHVVLEEYTGIQDSTGLKIEQLQTTATVSPVAVIAAAPIASGALAVETILRSITELFAQKTGYDVADLDPDHQLEADLGIDTVKQAELLGLIRQQYNLAADQTFKMSDTPTLRAIAEYVVRQTAAAAAVAAPLVSAPVLEKIEEPKAQVLVFGGATGAEAVAHAQAQLADATELGGALLNQRSAQLTQAGRLSFSATTLEEARDKAKDAGRRRAKMLVAQGIFLNEGAPLANRSKLAFVFPGQGSQYVGMMKDLAAIYPVVAETFKQADEILLPLIGTKLTSIVWADTTDEQTEKAADAALRETQNCQPAMLTADVAMLRLLMAHGVRPDMVAGHSLGEYAACVAAGVLTFADALYAVSARGREMAGVDVADNGKMAMVAADSARTESILAGISGFVIAANKNCHTQTVIAGESAAVEQAIAQFVAAGIEAREIPVSHAFHCKIVAPAAAPLKRVLEGLAVSAPRVPISSNVDASFYPNDRAKIIDLMALQLASPVQFIDQVNAMYQAGARIFIEVGPRRAITGFVRNILGDQEHRALATNHPKKPGIEGFLEVLAALSADGVDVRFSGDDNTSLDSLGVAPAPAVAELSAASTGPAEASAVELPRVAISGVSVVLPTEQPLCSIDGDHFTRLLRGDNFITPLERTDKQAILDKNVVRLNKTGGEFEALNDLSEVIQLAARFGNFDLVSSYGIDASFADALDVTGRLAIAVGIDALRDAGLPLVRYYRSTSTGKQLADRWGLPASLAPRTGVILGAAFPGVDRVIDDVSRHMASVYAGKSAATITQLVEKLTSVLHNEKEIADLRAMAQAQIDSLRDEANLYRFNRKFLFRVLALGHAQLAQTILAQGPNTQVNAACASGTQAIGIAHDWIRLGRCDRVLVVTADDVTGEHLLPWIGAGFLASGAATIESRLEHAAIPFGATRNGMILGAGASGFVVERSSCIAERGMQPVADLLHTEFVNSAFHGTRLDASFIKTTLANVVSKIATDAQVAPDALAKRTFFMSHETYTPARGGSSAAEVEAIRHAFGDSVRDLLIANTKGYTGHPMGASIEDVVAIKGLQHQQLPAIANMGEMDPTFADLNFARGGKINADYALRFGAGFGSQIAIAVYGRNARQEARLQDATMYQSWIEQQSGRAGAGMELVNRTLRVAEQGGVAVSQLGIPSLQPIGATVKVETSVVAAAPVAAVASLDKAQVLKELTQMFAQHTGYDVADLDPAHQLEADLGIDTVKQAEIFSLIRTQYKLPKDEAFKLSETQTLNAIVDYVVGKSVAGTSPAVTPIEQSTSVAAPTPVVVVAAAPVPAVASLDKAQVLKELTQMFAQHTGYDVADLDPAHQLEADLGIDTVKQAEIFSLIRTHYNLSKDDAFKLSDVQTLNAIVDYVVGKSGSVAAPAPVVVVAAAPAAAVVAAAPVAAVASLGQAQVLKELTQMFAQHTGYDVADLDPSHQLEADLGIDTVKQAEIFSLIRNQYNLAKDEAFKLTDVQTLNAIADYVIARSGSSIPAAPVSATSEVTADGFVEHGESAAPAKTVGDYGQFNAWHVGPVALAETKESARPLAERNVVIVGGTTALRQAFSDRLASTGARVRCEDAQTFNGQNTDDVVMLIDALPSFDAHAMQQQVAEVFAVARTFARSGRKMDNAGFLIVGQSGGLFGFANDAPSSVVMGAMAGVAKSLNKEWPNSACLAVDLPSDCTAEHAAQLAVQEWLTTSVCEVGWMGGERYTLRRMQKVQAEMLPLAKHALVVATGAARGVTFRILQELATRTRLRMVILGRTEGVAPCDSVIAGRTEAEQKEIAKAALTAAGDKVTPAAIKRWLQREEGRLEIWHNLETLRRLGSDVELIACDTGDGNAMAHAVASIRWRYGSVDVLLHGAGTEESKLLADKDAESFARIFPAKATAALQLWEQMRPRRMITMGSVSGRFGNFGQVDYAAANELMAALARYTQRNVLNIAWTAWGDVGMATRGSVRNVLEASGVDMLPVTVGVAIGADLIASALCGDVVVAGRMGEFESTERATDGLVQSKVALPVVFHKREEIPGGAVYVRRFDPRVDIGLDHHRIEGVAVVPGVLGVEMMTQAAEHLTGGKAIGLEGVRFDSPIKLFRDEALDVQIEVKQNGTSVDAAVVTLFKGPGGKLVRRQHFTGRVRVGAPATAALPLPNALEVPREPAITRDDIYRRYFHGPTFQVLSKLVSSGEDGVRALPISERPMWLCNIDHGAFHSMPLLREAGFQASGLWEMMELGRMALPSGIEEVRFGTRPKMGARLMIEARRRSAEAQGSVFDVWVRDAESGEVYDYMRGYKTITLRDLNAAERFEPSRAHSASSAWLFVEIDEIRGLIAGDMQAASERFLSPSEQARFATLKVEKRRLEWLAVRIAAKRLIREAYFGREGAIVPYPAITIHRDVLGAPVVEVIGDKSAAPWISMSHSANMCAVMLSNAPDMRVGIDIERVEKRDASFSEMYFTAAEREQLLATGNVDSGLTQVWAVKEAVLKALGLGARVDFRDVHVTLPLTADGRWQVSLVNEALKHAQGLGVNGAVEVTVEIHDNGTWVAARVMVPVTPSQNATVAIRSHAEVSV